MQNYSIKVKEYQSKSISDVQMYNKIKYINYINYTDRGTNLDKTYSISEHLIISLQISANVLSHIIFNFIKK